MSGVGFKVGASQEITSVMRSEGAGCLIVLGRVWGVGCTVWGGYILGNYDRDARHVRRHRTKGAAKASWLSHTTRSLTVRLRAYL